MASGVRLIRRFSSEGVDALRFGTAGYPGPVARVVVAAARTGRVEMEPDLAEPVAPSDSGLALMVAWKFIDGSDRVSVAVYRRHDGARVTVADAVARVLDGRPDCVDAALALVGSDRELDAFLGVEDVEVIGDDGRSSIDLEARRSVLRGGRSAPAAWFAAGCGTPDVAEVWADLVARSPVNRFIFGTDGRGGPFGTVYVG